jgi:chromosome segregation ATPase
VRLHRISLQDYRGVGRADVVLARNGVTIIQGPNEVGKSSLAEALQFLLEEPDSSTKRRLKAAKPVDVDAGPWVEVELDTGPYHVVYSKQWLTSPKTNLQILAPVPENLTGRTAHDRMRTILGETLDEALLRALYYQQGESIAQAAVGESRALAAALDAAATSGALGGEDAAGLWAKVQEERLRYFTLSGKATAERARLDGKVTELRVQSGELRTALDALDSAADRYRRIHGELSENAEQEVEQVAVVDEHTARWDKASALQREVERLDQAAQTAGAEAREAISADEERGRLVSTLADAKDALQAFMEQAEREAPALESARAAQGKAVQERDISRDARKAAENKSRRARGDFEHFREVIDCQLLTERQERIAGAEKTSGRAAAFLETCLIDETKLKEIEAAVRAALEARARLSGQNPTVHVEALRDLEVSAGEGRVDLHAGQVYETIAAGDIELTLGDIARVAVSGGAGTQLLKDVSDAADEHLDDLYRAVGISGEDPLGRARELVRRRREELSASERAAQVLKENLRDLTPQLLLGMIDRAKASIAAYQLERDASTPLPADLDDARTRSEQEAKVFEEASRHEGEWQEKLDQAIGILVGIQDEASQRTGQIELAQGNVATAEQQLEQARGKAQDTDLVDKRQQKEQDAAEAEAAHLLKANELATADADSAALLLKNAQGVLGRIHDESKALELESARIKTELEVRGEAGLHDQLALVESQLAQHEREKTLTDRRAAAAQLLYTRLAVNRDAAKRSYVAPFKRQLDAFGRIVFGPTVSIEVDHDTLEITSRTLGGRTVPYDSLSAGTREQLCVLARLACAALVSPASDDQPDAGVPVIFDDALGYSDAGRLERVGAAFSAASQQSQVIVLTCVPERYRNIGSATVVRLEEASLDPSVA